MNVITFVFFNITYLRKISFKWILYNILKNIFKRILMLFCYRNKNKQYINVCIISQDGKPVIKSITLAIELESNLYI